MKRIQALIIVLLCQNALADSAVFGRWQTFDEKTEKPKAIIEITPNGEGLKGRIVALINPAKKDPICEKCSGEKKDQPIQGMQTLTGFKSKDGQEWTDGEVLDPENGKTYKCRLQLKDDGKSLEVRGFVGISLFGRSQTWLREITPP